MNGFVSHKKTLEKLLPDLISNPELHSRWLNTLSYLENTGAKKIAKCEHPTLVKEEMLKHAAEEFRHAYYLKSQIEKISPLLEDYSIPNILGGFSTLHYLHTVDLYANRLFRSKEAAYLLVTYAIELRALELYPLYDEALKRANSKVHVRSILFEEKEHLEEIERELNRSPYKAYLEQICSFESKLCESWLQTIVLQHILA